MNGAAQGYPTSLYRDTWKKDEPKVDGPPPGKHDGPFEARQPCGIGATNINNKVSIEVFDLNGNQIEISDTVTSIEALKEEISQRINTFSGFIQLIGPNHEPLNDFDSVSTVFVLVSKQPMITRLLGSAKQPLNRFLIHIKKRMHYS